MVFNLIKVEQERFGVLMDWDWMSVAILELRTGKSLNDLGWPFGGQGGRFIMPPSWLVVENRSPLGKVGGSQYKPINCPGKKYDQWYDHTVLGTEHLNPGQKSTSTYSQG